MNIARMSITAYFESKILSSFFGRSKVMITDELNSENQNTSFHRSIEIGSTLVH